MEESFVQKLLWRMRVSRTEVRGICKGWAREEVVTDSGPNNRREFSLLQQIIADITDPSDFDVSRTANTRNILVKRHVWNYETKVANTGRERNYRNATTKRSGLGVKKQIFIRLHQESLCRAVSQFQFALCYPGLHVRYACMPWSGLWCMCLWSEKTGLK